MPYCAVHERAWYPGPQEAGWIALTCKQVEATQALARQYDFVEQVRVQPAACDQCEREQRCGSLDHPDRPY